jgi:hypothetical protein
MHFVKKLNSKKRRFYHNFRFLNMTENSIRKRKVGVPESKAENGSDASSLDDERDLRYQASIPRPGLSLPEGSWLMCLILTGFALWTRLYKINWNDHVVWDEAHFG